MKRITMIFLTVLMALVFSACGTGTTSGTADNTLSKPDDPLELAKQIAETEVLGDTLESAYQQGVPRALDWLDLYFMESSDPSPERRAEIEEQYPTTEELLYGISAAEASEAGWYDIWLVRYTRNSGPVTSNTMMRITETTALNRPKPSASRSSGRSMSSKSLCLPPSG